MNGQPTVKPLRFIVEASIPQLHELVQPLLAWLTPREPHAHVVNAPREEEEDDDGPAKVASTADPPAPAPVRPRGNRAPPPGPAVTLPPALRQKYRLGSLCPARHEYERSGMSLKRGSHCLKCEQERQRTRKHSPPVLSKVPRAPDRPELPTHLALTAFLSPITCNEPSHRYRGEPQWTLRYLEGEQCVQCVTQQSTQALAGD